MGKWGRIQKKSHWRKEKVKSILLSSSKRLCSFAWLLFWTLQLYRSPSNIEEYFCTWVKCFERKFDRAYTRLLIGMLHLELIGHIALINALPTVICATAISVVISGRRSTDVEANRGNHQRLSRSVNGLRTRHTSWKSQTHCYTLSAFQPVSTILRHHAVPRYDDFRMNPPPPTHFRHRFWSLPAIHIIVHHV